MHLLPLPLRKMGKCSCWPSFFISLQSPHENCLVFKLPQSSLSFSLWNIIPQSPSCYCSYERAEDYPPLQSWTPQGNQKPCTASHPHLVCRTFIIPTAAQCCWNLSCYTSEPQQKWRYKVFEMVRINYHSRSIQETRWSCNRLHVIGNSWVKKIVYYGKFCTSRQTCLNLN